MSDQKEASPHLRAKANQACQSKRRRSRRARLGGEEHPGAAVGYAAGQARNLKCAAAGAAGAAAAWLQPVEDLKAVAPAWPHTPGASSACASEANAALSTARLQAAAPYAR